MNFETGEIFYIDKPLKWTSFDVVNKIRLMLKQTLGIKKIKVGHAGTLDPLATGIVTVCIGRATKKIDELMGHDKEYVATLRFGATTPSFDLEKEIDATYPTEHLTREMIENALKEHFTGEIEQTPPLFSAIRVNGKRAYELARKGSTDVELKSRKVTVYSIGIEECDLPDVTLRIRCSKGTYIRSLARDIGLAVGSGAHLIRLERVAVGNVDKSAALTLEQLQKLFDAEKEAQGIDTEEKQ
ncbi:MAG: tRNA pseudouridine(55) synthase TruB [Bacteroidales bacterium]|nr:tRNA pseudouridine(55) synthase TruB [Bacteroidales bacterium]